MIVAASLPAIASSLKATSSQAYWCGSGFLFAQTVAQPIYGGFAETFGYKFCLLLALGIFTGASLLCALAQDIGWLIGARVVCFWQNALEEQKSVDEDFRFKVLGPRVST